MGREPKSFQRQFVMEGSWFRGISEQVLSTPKGIAEGHSLPKRKGHFVGSDPSSPVLDELISQ